MPLDDAPVDAKAEPDARATRRAPTSAKDLLDSGNASFGVATGACVRCGATDDVAKVRGANLCGPCLRNGVSPRYDIQASRAKSAECARSVREKNDGMRMAARAKNERRKAAEVAKAAANG